MSKSRLSHKLSLCELIHQLDQDSCIAVIQSIYHEFGCKNLNELLIKMILQWEVNTTTQSFKAMENIIKFMIVDNRKKVTNSHNSSNLLQLPSDLICKTSLYLNENDIFNFEKCCRLFYQMINKSSYLNQSNNFKTFIINPDKLSPTTMCKHSCSFFKYSKPTTLIITPFNRPLSVEQVQKQWAMIRCLNAFNDDNWLSNMIGSIKTLEIEKYAHGTAFFNELLIDAIFDPDQSTLEKLIIAEKNLPRNDDFNCFNNNWMQYQNASMIMFKQKYQDLDLKLQREHQEKNVHVLKCVHHIIRGSNYWYAHNLAWIKAKHLWITGANAQLVVPQFCRNLSENSELKMMTFEAHCSFRDTVPSWDTDTTNIDNSNFCIETVRFIDWKCWNRIYIFDDEEMIQSLNFHNSVKNMTLHICFRERGIKEGNFRYYFGWLKIAITNLLNKKHYSNLTNLNILIECITLIFDSNGGDTADWIAGILKRNANVLGHQFAQLNIGLRVKQESLDSDHVVCKACYVFEWNSTVNDKFLAEYKQFVNNQSPTDRKSNVKKFRQLRDQWV